ncbi:MAG TPA: hypothetical protein DCE43_10335, partial [Planctomycetaceae bacterium]|nr:hypothetical protein [Planctomycetaceae bacterium]
QPSSNAVSGEAGADPRLEKESADGGLFGSGSDLKIDLESGTPEHVWRKFFAKNRPSPTSLTTMVLRLHQQQKHQHVMAAINEALIAGQSQPWMYDVLAM